MEDPLNIYLKEISRYPLLTREEEIKLGKKISEGDEEARKEASYLARQEAMTSSTP